MLFPFFEDTAPHIPLSLFIPSCGSKSIGTTVNLGYDVKSHSDQWLPPSTLTPKLLVSVAAFALFFPPWLPRRHPLTPPNPSSPSSSPGTLPWSQESRIWCYKTGWTWRWLCSSSPELANFPYRQGQKLTKTLTCFQSSFIQLLTRTAATHTNRNRRREVSNISTSSPLPFLGINPLQDLSLFLISHSLSLWPSSSDFTVPRTPICMKLTSNTLISTQKALRSSQRLRQVLPWVVLSGFQEERGGGDMLPFPSTLPSPVKDPHLTRRYPVRWAWAPAGAIFPSLPPCIFWDAGCSGRRNETRRRSHDRLPGQTPDLNLPALRWVLALKTDLRRTHLLIK